MIWKIHNQTFNLSQKSLIMGVLNVTPDSFSDGGFYLNPQLAFSRAERMLEEGADIIDIGGESSRPGATQVSAQEEISRVIPVLKLLRKKTSCLISIDTYKTEVAKRALAEGADILNDISGFRFSPQIIKLASEYQAGLVVMHMQGTPQSMQKNPHYHCVISEISEFFAERFHFLVKQGISPEAICFDPGIGFGKRTNHNLEILANLESLHYANRPILLGISRKSLIGKILEMPKPDLAFNTSALVAWGQMHGVQVHRVHDIPANCQILKMISAIQREKID